LGKILGHPENPDGTFFRGRLCGFVSTVLGKRVREKHGKKSGKNP
jgi:hypothetical protein